MSPKTGFINKESNMESNNQSFSNEELDQNLTINLNSLTNLNNGESNQNSTVNQTELNNILKFKLDFNIKDQLIVTLNNFTSLLYNDKNKEKVIEKANNLVHNLVDLPLKIDHNKDDEINSTDTDLFKPTLVINSRMRIEIIDLLIKNKNFSTLFKDSNDKNTKSNLIMENNNLIIKLIQYPVEILKLDDQANGDFVWQQVLNNVIREDNQLITKYEKEIHQLKEKISNLSDNQLVAKSEFDEKIIKYEKEICELKEKNLKELSLDGKESITFFCQLKIQKSEIFVTPEFKCLSLDWNLEISMSDDYLYFALILLNELDLNKKLKVNCEFILLSQDNNNIRVTTNLEKIFFQNQFVSFGLKIDKSKFYLNIYDLMAYLQVNLTAEWIKFLE